MDKFDACQLTFIISDLQSFHPAEPIPDELTDFLKFIEDNLMAILHSKSAICRRELPCRYNNHKKNLCNRRWTGKYTCPFGLGGAE